MKKILGTAILLIMMLSCSAFAHAEDADTSLNGLVKVEGTWTFLLTE